MYLYRENDVSSKVIGFATSKLALDAMVRLLEPQYICGTTDEESAPQCWVRCKSYIQKSQLELTDVVETE